MADILSQDEVDLLLNAVSEGEIATPAEEAPSERALDRDITTYDFRRPERVSKEQFKGLQSLFEAFARELSISLPPFLRQVVRVDLASIDQLTYDEFILSVARPTCLTIVDMSPLEGNAVIELSQALVFPMVDRLLGGKGVTLPESRELTEIENRIIQRIELLMLESLRRSWSQLVEFNMSIVQQESDPLIVQVVAGSEMVILIGYELHLGDTVGSMNMCIPLVVLSPVIDQITQQTHFKRKMDPETARTTRAHVERIIRRAEIPVEAILGHARLPLEELARLQVDDIVQLDTDVKDPVSVHVGGLPRYKAQPGRTGEQSAVQLVALTRD